MIFCVSIFIFCLEPTVTEQLDGNDFRHYYDFFSKLPFWNYLMLCLKFFSNNYKALWQRHLKRYITVEDFTDIITIWTNFFLSKYLSTKIGKSAWKIIIYTIIRACSSKNIAPRHFTYYCMLLFVSNKSSL